jgi:cytoskeletal protein CcmA (bactofilin family)
VNANSRESVIREDTVIKGEMKTRRQIEVFGYFEGDLTAEKVLVREGGKVFGTMRADDADIQGTLQGEIFVNKLIKIGSTGAVVGNVQYGQIAMDLGGELSAKLRNVPPEIMGDLDLTVHKGKAVRITLIDLHAVDPDDHAKDLIFNVTNPRNGFVALARAPSTPVTNFTQADLEAGSVAFVHNGASAPSASFEVVVVDSKGATSGSAKTVNVNVIS